MTPRTFLALPLAAALLLAAGCGGDEPGAGGPGRGGRPAMGGPGGAEAAVPVEVATAERRPISSYLETNGTIEAEYEVDVVARVAAPVAALLVEEGDRVEAGQVMARLEDTDFRSELEIARVEREETRLAFERARELSAGSLISAEEFERARAAYEAANARFESASIRMGYTEVRAPFAGLVVRRYVDLAEQVAVNSALFRVSDFNPLLCPIQIPERDLPRVRPGQDAYLTVESRSGERFAASVLRISPVVDAETGTVKVTLELRPDDALRPGMFARVFVEVETRPEALVIPRSALSLESIGDTVYVVADGVAERREVELGFREGDSVEIVSGVAAGETVVTVGQDGLSQGTPVTVMRRDGSTVATGRPAAPEGGAAGERAGGRPDLASMTPEQLERVKERMRARGMTEEQIEERISRARAAAGGEGAGATAPPARAR